MHDELILEAPQDEIAILEELVPEVMEGAVSLSVPLKVETASSSNWYCVDPHRARRWRRGPGSFRHRAHGAGLRP